MNKEEKERFDLLLESDDSDPQVQYEIGACYLDGKGTDINKGEGEKWLQLAADHGHQGAMDYFARPQVVEAQEEAHPSARDIVTEENLPKYSLQAEDGDVNAQYAVANYWKSKDEGEFLRYLEMASIQGNGNACFDLALYNLEHNRDLDKVINYLTNAADCGIPQAMQKLGECYGYGVIVNPNIEISTQWFERYAQRGDEEAIAEVAGRYLTGEGVPKQSGSAYKLIGTVDESRQAAVRLRTKDYEDYYLDVRAREQAEVEGKERERKEQEQKEREEKERKAKEATLAKQHQAYTEQAATKKRKRVEIIAIALFSVAVLFLFFALNKDSEESTDSSSAPLPTSQQEVEVPDA